MIKDQPTTELIGPLGMHCPERMGQHSAHDKPEYFLLQEIRI